MKKKNKLGKYEKGLIITGVVVAIMLLILLTADGVKNIGKNDNPIGLSEQGETIVDTPNAPTLSAGMIPVKYNGDNLIICQNDNSWYNYSEGKPAYMMLNDGVYQSELVADMTNKKLASENIGQVVQPNEQGSIYMWIPRYAQNAVTGEIKYVPVEKQPGGDWELPETFSYMIADETKPDFSLSGVWVEKGVLANNNAVNTKVNNMTGENNTYGFIANTIAVNAESGFRETWLPYVRELDAKQTEGSFDIIDNQLNINRTVLKVVDGKKHEPIKANATYNLRTEQIEITVTYKKYKIERIMLESTTELAMTSINGITKATTEGIEIEDRKVYTIEITDIEGNTKKLSVQVNKDYKRYYGMAVTNYTCASKGVSTWRVFHVDEENIYLIADDYVAYNNLPTSTNGNKLQGGGKTDYIVTFSSVRGDYTGSAWIRANTNPQATKWLSWINSYPSSTNNNIKAVAYMMDTKSWSGFAGEKAEYAIGGPTLELYCASYKVTHPDRYIDYSMNQYGYCTKMSDGTVWNVSSQASGLTKDDYNSIYIKSSTTKAEKMWIASPNYGYTYNGQSVVAADSSGRIGGSENYNINANTGFRPVVCLNSSVKLVDNGNNTCSIQ